MDDRNSGLMKTARALVQVTMTVEVDIGHMLDADDMDRVLREVRKLALDRITKIKKDPGITFDKMMPFTRIVLDGDMSRLSESKK